MQAQQQYLWTQTIRMSVAWNYGTRNGKSGFTPGKGDPTVYFQSESNGEIEIAGWYVNNRLLAANSVETKEKMVMDIKDLGEPT